MAHAIPNNRFILVEGGMGSGKSKLLRHLVKIYTDPQRYLSTRLIPLYITYREFYNDYDASLDSVVNGLSERNPGFEPLDGSRYLILIDGFDERDKPI